MARTVREFTYIDTSVWCAYAFNEPEAPEAARWLLDAELDHTATAWWTWTEFVSAAGIKRRVKKLDEASVARASQAFKSVSAMTHALSVQADDFHRAADLCAQHELKLRAGDALHLAVALRHRCKALASLDAGMNHAAQALGLHLTVF